MNEEIIAKVNAENYDVESAKTKQAVTGLYEWIEAAVFSLLCVSVIFTFLFRIVGVDGNSMLPTLHDKERLIITHFMYKPQHGDIVIINRYTQEPLVKRVIAVAGDTLELNGDTNQVIVNGKALDETYILGITEPIQFIPNKQVVPDDCVFVMGDNRQDSKDSRFMDEVGFIKVEDIMGKAIFRFFPLSKAGGLY